MPIQGRAASTAAILSISMLMTACGGSDSTPQTAAHCFDDAIYQSSNKIEQKLSLPNEGNAQRTYTTSAQKSSFNGQTDLIEHNVQYLRLNSLPTGSYSNTYYLSPESPHIYKNYGFIHETRTDVIRKGIYTYFSPAIDRRALLELGSSLEYRIQGNAKLEPNGTTTPINEFYIITYAGDENISIGNRNLKACKFKISKNEKISFEWIYKSIPIQSSHILQGNLAEENIVIEKTTQLTNNGQDF